jgi:hypothetical protein
VSPESPAVARQQLEWAICRPQESQGTPGCESQAKKRSRVTGRVNFQGHRDATFLVHEVRELPLDAAATWHNRCLKQAAILTACRTRKHVFFAIKLTPERRAPDALYCSCLLLLSWGKIGFGRGHARTDSTTCAGMKCPRIKVTLNWRKIVPAKRNTVPYQFTLCRLPVLRIIKDKTERERARLLPKLTCNKCDSSFEAYGMGKSPRHLQ